MRETLLLLVPAIVVVGLFVWLMHELGTRPSLLRQLDLEMRERGWLGRAARFLLPVYSAETVQGKEAEFIRDRLPSKFPTLLVVVVTLGVLLAIWRAMS